jgi:dTDP-glucose 4,6-dehydratase
MRILVTGGAGFIGSNFVRTLVERYPHYEVVILDKLTYAGNLANLHGILQQTRCSFLQGDIRDAHLVESVMQRCQAVVHFAAETHVDTSIMHPNAFITSNIEGTFVLLEAARKNALQRFIHISTDEVYGNALSPAGISRPSLETDPQRPMSPYAASKAAAENLVYSYWITYGLPIVITRCSNNYGPFQFSEKQLPLFMLNALNNRPLPVYGNGLHTRDWIHVSDHVEALLNLLHQEQTLIQGEIFNIGAGEERTTLQNAALILELLEKPAELITFVTDRQGHVQRHAVDTTKIRTLCGWQPRVSFVEGLRQTLNWYLMHNQSVL